MLVWRKSALAALMVAGFAATSGAQQKGCDIDENTPQQITRALLFLMNAQSASKPADATKALKDAVRLLNEGDKTRNPVGRSFVFGKALVAWMTQPGLESGYASRGSLGFTTDTAATYDLVAGIDSAFKIVEASNAECVSQTAPWRQQKGWVTLVEQAIALGNADGKSDSAIMVAKRSLQLFKDAPYGYMVLAKASADKNLPKDAINYYKEAVVQSAKDTSAAMQDQRRSMLLTIGNYASDLYDGATGDDKTFYLTEAKSAYEQLGKDPGTKYADAARGGAARLAAAAGDTAAIRASYADHLANPGAFSYASLMGAAVNAARANQNADAIKLFEAAKALNPYHRDVLYNLSRLYLLDSAFAKGLPLASQLISVDPSNPDNYQLLTVGYAALRKIYDTKQKEAESKAKVFGQRANAPRATAAVQKANIDSAAKINPIIKAYGDSAQRAIDSALKYQSVGEKLPARVTFTEFTPGEGKVTIGGSVLNQTEAARDFTFKLDFLDKDGNVVTSQDVKLSAVPAKGSTSFQAVGTGAGIVAFKYPPIS